MSTAITPENAGGKLPPKGRVALIAGPTASGKSDLAVRLALAHGNAVVINADSAQVYADLRVLSARPSDDEMQGVPHRLFGTWDGAEACSAADWAKVAKAEIAAAHALGRLPIVVGGTGMYIRTLLEGISPVPRIDPAVRAAVRAMPREEAYAALQAEDAPRAASLHRNDTLRIARALEVVRSTGMPLAYWQQLEGDRLEDAVELHPVVLHPHLGTLRARGVERFVRMVEGGAADEVRALLDRGLAPDLPVMRAIGVPELAGWLRGVWDREAAIARGQQATWQYMRRQFTWMRTQLPEEWLRIETEPFDTRAIFEGLLRG